MFGGNSGNMLLHASLVGIKVTAYSRRLRYIGFKASLHAFKDQSLIQELK